jgi:hypothetical protein
MVEIERWVQARHRLDGRFQSVEVLISEVEASEAESNHRMAEVESQFAREDARIKLRLLYPATQ